MSTSVLRIEGLHFGWPDGPVVFDGLDVALPAGLTWLTGDDGCGKSTLLALTAGALTAQSGRLCVAGTCLHDNPAGYREQVFRIDPQTESSDALAAASYLEGLERHWPRLSATAMADLIDGFGLRPHLHKPLYMLSTGSRRKVWLTAAFSAGAPLTLIDQPFAALDAPSAGFLREVLEDVSEHPGRAWWVADHNVPDGTPETRVIRLP